MTIDLKQLEDICSENSGNMYDEHLDLLKRVGRLYLAQAKAPEQDVPDVIKYLLGEGSLDGCYYPDFPDKGERYPKRYWWRNALRHYLTQRPPAPTVAAQVDLDALKLECMDVVSQTMLKGTVSRALKRQAATQIIDHLASKGIIQGAPMGDVMELLADIDAYLKWCGANLSRPFQERIAEIQAAAQRQGGA
ncbi:hypothetical protein LZG74_25635 [Dyadobacter sp. CY327]|uniref:hypothetical protein n=1 Tax=Dyadobacter sp. CY327 TaxID=2907301 RepID=UPI001F2617E4|nr:hypothetical protein [Dyadobacter sp. CY327]MCE7073716.1 hypothetical protein [Dyadobacter sp. CY327]